MRAFFPVLLALALCACGQSTSAPDPEAAAEIGPAQDLSNRLPARDAATPRYVGRWAAAANACGADEWVFDRDRLTAPNQVLCSLDNVQMIPTGYSINASCSSAEPTRPFQIQLSFAESAQAMLASGGPWAGEVGLVHCPTDTPSPPAP